MPAGKSVAVFGAGIAGLTAAHELALRDFAVQVYEPRAQENQVGGKARTQYWHAPGIGTLPGEHGFRFFPRFYSLVRDTMERIPLDSTSAIPDPLAAVPGDAVRKHLVGVPVDAIGRRGEEVVPMPRRWAASSTFLTDMIQFLFNGIDVPIADQVHLAWHLLRFFSSGDKRRLGEFEKQSFWDFVGASQLSKDGKEMVLNMPKVFVAMSAKEGNARTLGNVLFLMLRDMMRNESEADSILAGPTTATWLLPWRQWLSRLGVGFQQSPGKALAGLDCNVGARRIDGARLADGSTVSADYYVVAVPLEVAQSLVLGNADLRKFEQLDALAAIDTDRALGWMVGAQFYLKSNVVTPPGHLGWADCRWALTGISQAQFWDPHDFATTYGHGSIEGLVSLNVSDWKQAGVFTSKKAETCTRGELFDELVGQAGALCQGRRILDPANIAIWRIDDDLEFDGAGPDAKIVRNDSRLLIHPPLLWEQRPEPATEVTNLFLAADYVRNDMDLATMEGANQAAREAVNALLDRAGSPQPHCRVVNHLEENEWAAVRGLKKFDDWKYERGLDPTPELMQVAPLAGKPGAGEQWDALRKVEKALLQHVAQWKG